MEQPIISKPIKINFDTETSTFILNIDKNAVDLESKKEHATRDGLSRKNEFHLTVIGRDTGEKILKILELLGEDKKIRTLNQIQKICELFEWKFSLKQEFYYLEKIYDDAKDLGTLKPEKRKSIIQVAEIKDLNQFYKKLNLLLETKFKIPFPHVTLYTTSTLEEKKLRGIGVYSKSQFEELKPERI